MGRSAEFGYPGKASDRGGLQRRHRSLWDPDETRTIRDEDMSSGACFSVCPGSEITGCAVVTLGRDEVV